MIRKIDHIVITTAQLESCLAFYEKLGFDVRSGNGRYELFAGDFKINVHIKGSELSPHAKNVQTGSADLCFEVEGSLEEFRQGLVSKCLSLEVDIVGRAGVNGTMRSIYLRDPDGNLVEFCSYL